MVISKATFFIVAISVGIYWLMYAPSNWPEDCDYPMSVRAMYVASDGLKILVNTDI